MREMNNDEYSDKVEKLYLKYRFDEKPEHLGLIIEANHRLQKIMGEVDALARADERAKTIKEQAPADAISLCIAELEKLRTELKYNYDKQIDLWIKKGNPIEGGQVMRNILEGIDMAISALRQPDLSLKESSTKELNAKKDD